MRSLTCAGVVELLPRFRSRYLPAERDVHVYLPPGYASSPGRRYPVLYLQDGQNLFDPGRSYVRGQHWRVRETADERMGRGTAAPAIIVGVDHAGVQRIEEYTPSRNWRGLGGRAERYGRMLVEELKPQIDAHFRTRREPGDTALGGSSLGGLATLYLGLRHPEVFGNLAALSPSVWWDRRFIVRRVRRLWTKPPVRMWLDVGTAEGQHPEKITADVRALRDALVAKGFRLGVDLAYLEAAGAGHHERAWAERFGTVLEFLFPPGGGFRPWPPDCGHRE